MWLTQGNLNVKVSRASDAEVEWLRSKDSGLSFADKRTIFTTGKAELRRFFELDSATFPAGFLPSVLKRAAECGIQAQVIDGRAAPAQPIEHAFTNGQELRDYQLAGVEAAIKATRGIIQIGTGGGKTNVAVAIAERFPSSRWLFLVHRSSLMAQAADRYEALTGKRAGRIGEGKWEEQHHFTCATFQSLAAALKKGAHAQMFRSIQGLMVDEAHTLPAESYYRVANSLTNAYWRLGISATPLDRGDQRSIFAIGTLGPIIFKHTADELIQAGHLARPVIRMVAVNQELDGRDEQGFITRPSWQEVYERCVVRSKLRNRVLLAAAQKAEKPALVFVKDIAHGQAFHAALAKRGVKSDFVWGAAGLAARQAAARRLVRGDIDVLVCSVIFQEGIDLPELRSVIIASAGKSVIAALQRVGRGMRLAEDKNTFEVWDVADLGNSWLRRHANARKHAYQREGYSVSIVQLAPSELPGPEKPGVPFSLK